MDGIPGAGDIAWVELDPVQGTEQGGRRPAIILTDPLYHEVSSRAVVCPITSSIRPWAFNLLLPSGMKTEGSILVDQVRTLHRPSRIFDWIERAPEQVLQDVRERLVALLGLDVTFVDY